MRSNESAKEARRLAAEWNNSSEYDKNFRTFTVAVVMDWKDYQEFKKLIADKPQPDS